MLFVNFVIAFSFSFLGSIPPGTLNLTIAQLGLQNKISLAWRFAFAASIIEYPYGWFAVKFQETFLSHSQFKGEWQILASVIMMGLGLLNLLAAKKSNKFLKKIQTSGFRRGLVLAILNPMVLPFWIGVTAYSEIHGLIDLSNPYFIQSFLLGICLGAFLCLMVFAFLSKFLLTNFQHHPWIKMAPGYLLLLLGVFTLFNAIQKFIL